MKPEDENVSGVRLSLSLVAWALAYPDDPVAKMVISSLPPGMVAKLQETFKQEHDSHAKALSELATLLQAGGVKLA